MYVDSDENTRAAAAVVVFPDGRRKVRVWPDLPVSGTRAQQSVELLGLVHAVSWAMRLRLSTHTPVLLFGDNTGAVACVTSLKSRVTSPDRSRFLRLMEYWTFRERIYSCPLPVGWSAGASHMPADIFARHPAWGHSVNLPRAQSIQTFHDLLRTVSPHCHCNSDPLTCWHAQDCKDFWSWKTPVYG